MGQTITTFDQDTAKSVREKAQKALEKFAESLGVGVQLERGALGVGGNQFTIPVVFVVKGEGGVLETEERQAYKTWGASLGLKPEWLGSTFTHKDETFTITGLNSRSEKFPVQATNASGQVYGFPATLVVGSMTGDVDNAFKEKYRKAYLDSFQSRLVKEWKDWLDKPFQFKGEEVKAVGLVESVGRSRKPDTVLLEVISGERKSKQLGIAVDVFNAVIAGNLDAALQQQNKDRALGYKSNWYKHDKFDIPNNWLGVTVAFPDGNACKIVGLDTKRKTYPIVLQNSKGELVGYRVAAMKMLMTQQHPELQ
jgi:hypothetical protein